MTVSYPHITSDSGVADGRPCIEDTGVRVTEVYSATDSGTSIADVRTRFASRPLTAAEVYSALAYYHDNHAELETLRLADAKTAADTERERFAAIKRRFMGE